MVLLFGYPSSPFSQPKNIILGHLITSLSGIFFTFIPLPLFVTLALSVAIGMFFMIASNLIHPPAGGNPIAIGIGNYNYDFVFSTVLAGTILIVLLGIIINKYILKIKYPT